jgi:hypothetical protein
MIRLQGIFNRLLVQDLGYKRPKFLHNDLVKDALGRIGYR